MSQSRAWPLNTGEGRRGLESSSGGAHLLRLVPLLGLRRQVLRLRSEVRRLWLLVVIRLLALLAVTAHTLLSILRWHLSKGQGKESESQKCNSMKSNMVSIQQNKWVLC